MTDNRDRGPGFTHHERDGCGPALGDKPGDLLTAMRCEATYANQGVTMPVKLYERIKAYLAAPPSQPVAQGDAELVGRLRMILDTPPSIDKVELLGWRTLAQGILADCLSALTAPVRAAAGVSATYESERALLVAEVGECCRGSDPLCADGCLVEKALAKRQPVRAAAAQAISQTRARYLVKVEGGHDAE